VSLEEYYIGTEGRCEFYLFIPPFYRLILVAKPPLFPYAIWGVYERTLTDRARSNNAREGMNNAINLHFEVMHPPMSAFIPLLASFHCGIMADFRDLNAKRQISRPNRKWKEMYARKLQIVEDIANYDDIGNYLSALASTLQL
jgi:hypothetical protein